MSVTVSVALYRPATPYAWAAMRPLPVPPSPKFQRYAAIVPSGSYEDDALNVTVWRACGAEGEKTEDATGGRFPAAPGTADGLFDGVDQFGTSSDVSSANQYVLPCCNPGIVASSVVPGACGKNGSS